MKRFLAFAAILFGIPVFGIVAGEGIRAYYENEFSEVMGEAPNQTLREITLQDSCELPRFRAIVSSACETYDHIVLMRDASIWLPIIAMALLLLVWISGRIARNNRALLVALFGPGMKLVLFCLFGMIIVQGAIAAYGVYIVEAVLIERVHYFLVGGVALGALLGAFKMISAGLSLSRLPPLSAFGVAVSPAEQPELWQFVSNIAQKIGANRPNNIVLGLEPTFYATAAEVSELGEKRPLAGETMYLSLPLMRLLSSDELGSVIGHELGHFKGEDTRYSLRFVPIYSGVTRALDSLSKQEGASVLALVAAVAMLNFFLEQFAVAERRIGRVRELEADKSGSAVAGSSALASALVKISAYSPSWELAQGSLIDSINQGKPWANISLLYRVAMEGFDAEKDRDVLATEIAANRLSHPTDTHPTIEERMLALDVSLEEVVKTFAFAEEDSTSLVTNVEAIEQALTHAQSRVFVQLGVATLPTSNEEEPRAEEAEARQAS